MPDVGTSYSVIDGCRSCGLPQFETVLDYGLMPLSDGLVSPGIDREKEPLFPLTLVRCTACSLVQILETVDPDVLYGGEYPYYSSFSDELVANAKQNVESILDANDLGEDSLVVEIASNDGYLLQWFMQAGIPVLGVDPAKGPAQAAVERGIPTIKDFFGSRLARQLVDEGRRADVIVGNNVLAHVPDQNELVAAMAELLVHDGSIVMEFPYLVDLVRELQFDTVYHEHHCYFTVASVQQLFLRHGLQMVSVRHVDLHGGSVRVTFSPVGEPDGSVAEFLAEEERLGADESDFYEDFANRSRQERDDLVDLITELKQSGSTIAAYGAAAKGAILLNFSGLDESLIDYVVDRNIHKHGLEMPGVAIPIRDPEDLKVDPPDYLLLLAWNFKEEVMRQQSWYAEQGGRFIVPIPTPVVV